LSPVLSTSSSASGHPSAVDDPFADNTDDHLGKTRWSLDDAVDLCRRIEHALSTTKAEWHASLGGSVLMKGTSYKDVDIFLYPHAVGTKKKRFSKSKVLKTLQKTIGLTTVRKAEFNEYDKKIVYITHINDQRIDIFFVK